jgi:hypothetical protein
MLWYCIRFYDGNNLVEVGQGNQGNGEMHNDGMQLVVHAKT